jgi:hypothetical protein
MARFSWTPPGREAAGQVQERQQRRESKNLRAAADISNKARLASRAAYPRKTGRAEGSEAHRKPSPNRPAASLAPLDSTRLMIAWLAWF